MGDTLVVAKGPPTMAEWRSVMPTVLRASSGLAILLLDGGSVPQDVFGAAERIDPAPFVARAEGRIRDELPRLIHEFAASTGLLDLYHWRNQVSAFWFLPLSEMSRFRTPLVDELYQLALIDAVLESSRFAVVTLLSADKEFALAARQAAERHGVAFRARRLRSPRRGRREGKLTWLPDSLRYRVTWWGHGVKRVLAWWALRVARFPALPSEPAGRQRVLAFTLFPSLWERYGTSGQWRNRSLGDLPESLAGRGCDVIYVAAVTWSLKQLLFQRRRLARALTSHRVIPIDRAVSLWELLRSVTDGRWLRAYRRWRGNHRSARALFGGIDVAPLLRRVLDRDAWSAEVRQDLCVAQATARVAATIDNLRLALLAVEGQPIERAFIAGVREGAKGLPVLGVQTAMSGENHLGYRFLPDQVAPVGGSSSPRLAPAPDYVAAYGTTTRDMLQAMLGGDRVVLTGAIRYPHLGQRLPAAPAVLRRALDLAPEGPLILVATSIDPEESLHILELVGEVSARTTHVTFLFKFHYLCDMTRALRAVGRRRGLHNYRIFDGQLPELLQVSRAVVMGTTSVGIEAIALSCMPIVYTTTGHYDLGPLRDVREAVFFFSDATGLQRALEEVLTTGQEYERRSANWAAALKKMVYRADGNATQRLCDYLAERRVLAP